MSRAENSPAISWTFLLTAGILIRLAVVFQPSATIDMSTWVVVAETVVDGGDIYATGRVSWTAIWPLMLGALMHLSNITGIYFYIFVRILLLLNDIILLFIIKTITEKLNYSYTDSLKAQLLYFLNPLTLIITIYHPQFGSIAFTALIGSYYLTEPALLPAGCFGYSGQTDNSACFDRIHSLRKKLEGNGVITPIDTLYIPIHAKSLLYLQSRPDRNYGLWLHESLRLFWIMGFGLRIFSEIIYRCPKRYKFPSWASCF